MYRVVTLYDCKNVFNNEVELNGCVLLLLSENLEIFAFWMRNSVTVENP